MKTGWKISNTRYLHVEHSVTKIMSYVSHKHVLRMERTVKEQVETMQRRSSECLESLFTTDYIY